MVLSVYFLFEVFRIINLWNTRDNIGGCRNGHLKWKEPQPSAAGSVFKSFVPAFTRIEILSLCLGSKEIYWILKTCYIISVVFHKMPFLSILSFSVQRILLFFINCVRKSNYRPGCLKAIQHWSEWTHTDFNQWSFEPEAGTLTTGPHDWLNETNVPVTFSRSTVTFNPYLLTYSMEQSPSWEANWFCS